ncbi:MAG: transcription elongation factor GreA, partial [Chitinivibrionales bacterium]|nr:transcription elongation factor GreA [Chitinivibrionales bacterium]MBD3394432.1 transcription elongation factor GreA [Chitinivibrionales bacterium]
EYAIVPKLDADFSQGKISSLSPVGRGLIGHRCGEVVEIVVPSGLARFKTLEILMPQHTKPY